MGANSVKAKRAGELCPDDESGGTGHAATRELCIPAAETSSTKPYQGVVAVDFSVAVASVVEGAVVTVHNSSAS